MRKSLLMIISLVLAGCVSNDPLPKPTPSTVLELGSARVGVCEWNMRIHIDNSFTPAESFDIGYALTNWNRASGGRICFSVYWMLLNPAYEKLWWKNDGMRTLYTGSRKWQKKAAMGGSCGEPRSCAAVTYWQSDGKAADIFYFSRQRDLFRALTEHEIGHMLGLGHSKNPHDMMCDGGCLKPESFITSADKERLECLMDADQIGTYVNSCRPNPKSPLKQKP